MRRILSLAVAALLFQALAVRAANPTNYTHSDAADPKAASTGDEGGDCGCDEGNKHHGLFNKHKNQQSMDWGNCNCNGSYKFPVPPLYTYQWPGRYSQQLMTDYQSPWRFPPLRPYTDESPALRGPATGVMPTAAILPLRDSDLEVAPVPPGARTISTGEPEPISEKIKRYYGIQ